MSGIKLDKSIKREKNLKVLQSIDSSITEIIEDYTYIAVYQYEAIKVKWEKLEIEGPGFITKNNSDTIPYSFIILNKKGPTDFTLELSSVQKLKVQHPYIMIRCRTNGAPTTFGVWIHSEEERTALFSLFDRIVFKNEMPQSPISSSTNKSNLLKAALFNNNNNTNDKGKKGKKKKNEPPTSSSNNKSEALLSMLKSGNSTNNDSSSNNNDNNVSKANMLMAVMKPKEPAMTENNDNSNNNNVNPEKTGALLALMKVSKNNSSGELLTDGEIASRSQRGQGGAQNSTKTASTIDAASESSSSNNTAEKERALKSLLFKKPTVDSTTVAGSTSGTSSNDAAVASSSVKSEISSNSSKFISPSDILNRNK